MLRLRVALCVSGLSVVQEELAVYPFSRITDYHSRNKHFHMTIKTVMKASNFVCETAHVSGRSHRGRKIRFLLTNITI